MNKYELKTIIYNIKEICSGVMALVFTTSLVILMGTIITMAWRAL